MKPELKKDSLLKKFVRFTTLFLAVSFFLRGLFYFLVGIFSLTKTAQYGFIPFVNGLIYLGIYSVFVPVFFMLLRDLHRYVILDDAGLHSKLFGKTLDINWDDVLEVKSIKLFGLFTFRNKYLIVTKIRLTFLHILYGLFYGNTRLPSLPIDPTMYDDAKLIKRISNRAKKNQRIKSLSKQQ